MKNIFSFLGGALALAIAIYMVFGYYRVTTGQILINPGAIDSWIDKMFFGTLMIGCAIGYGSVAACLWFKLNPMKHRLIQVMFIASMLIFAAGVYYCIIFNSPW